MKFLYYYTILLFYSSESHYVAQTSLKLAIFLPWSSLLSYSITSSVYSHQIYFCANKYEKGQITQTQIFGLMTSKLFFFTSNFLHSLFWYCH